MDFFEGFTGKDWRIVTSSFVIVFVLNVLSNFTTYWLQQRNNSKANLEELVRILDHDLDTFINVTNLVEDNYKKGGMIWYDHFTHIIDSRKDHRPNELFLLSNNLKNKFFFYYTTSINLLYSLSSTQRGINEIYDYNTYINKPLDEEAKAKKLSELYKFQSDLVIDLRLKKIEAENLKKDLRNKFKFLKD